MSKSMLELGWTYPTRKKHLESLIGKSTGRTQGTKFQNKIQDFPIHKVPINLPKYRIDNGRTYAAQAKYIADNNLSADFFLKDSEADQVQNAQHLILKEMIKEKGLAEFFKTNEQSEALILSHDGYIINGNRRLCSWRELHLADPVKYARFTHVDVIILPPAAQKDIDELEARLQVHKDIKADYTWTARALMLRHRQATYNYSINSLSELFEMSEKDIEELLDMLVYAEAYLEERDKVGQYTIVDKSEYAFRQLHKRRSKIKEEGYKDVFEKLAYCLIDKSDEGRLYESIPDLADNLDKVIEQIESQFTIENADVEEEDGLLGQSNFTSFNGILKVIENELNHDQIREIVIETIESENSKSKEKSRRDFVLLQVKRANTALIEAASALNENTKKDGIDAQIQSIETSIKKLKDWLGDGDTN